MFEIFAYLAPHAQALQTNWIGKLLLVVAMIYFIVAGRSSHQRWNLEYANQKNWGSKFPDLAGVFRLVRFVVGGVTAVVMTSSYLALLVVAFSIIRWIFVG
jgi:hypothetical protein